MMLAPPHELYEWPTLPSPCTPAALGAGLARAVQPPTGDQEQQQRQDAPLHARLSKNQPHWEV